MPRNVIIPEPYNSWFTLKEAAAAMNFQAQYVRSLAKDGKLGKYPEDVVKLDMGGFQQWRVRPGACQRYKDNVGTSGFGAPGVRRFLLRFDSTKITEEAIRAALLAAHGEPGTEGEDDFAYEFAPAWKGQKGKRASKPKEPTEAVVASIVQSLTSGAGADDLDFGDNGEDDVEDVDDPLS